MNRKGEANSLNDSPRKNSNHHMNSFILRTRSQLITNHEDSVNLLKHRKRNVESHYQKKATSIEENENITSKSNSSQSIDILSIKDILSIDPISRTQNNIDDLINCFMDFKNFDIYSASIKIMIARIGVLETYKDANIILVPEGKKKINEWRAIISGQVAVKRGDKIESILKSGCTFGFDIENPEAEPNTDVLCYSTYSNDCEFLMIYVSDINQYYSPKVISGDISNKGYHGLESNYDGNLLTTASYEKLVEMLFDDEYLKIEPTFIIDFFLTYKIFAKDNTLLIDKIRNGVKNSILIAKTIFILQTWINYCFFEFENTFMQDFVLAILAELPSSVNELSEKIIATFYKRSLAFDITYNDEKENKFDATIACRTVNSLVDKNYCEFYIQSIPIGSPCLLHGMEPHDQIIMINDICCKNLSIASFTQILLTSTVIFFIIKRCKIKYIYYQDSMKELKKLAETYKIDSTIGGTFLPMNKEKDTFTPKKITDTIKKRLKLWKPMTLKAESVSIFKSKPTSSQDITSEESKDISNLGNVKEYLSCQNINVNEVRLRENSFKNATNHYSPDNSPIEDSRCAKCVIRVYNCSNDVRYFAISRCDNSEKIARVATTLFYKRQSVVQDTDSQFSRASTLSSRYFLFMSTITQSGIKNCRMANNAFDLVNKAPIGSRYFIAKSITELNSNEDIEMSKDSHFTLADLNPLIVAKILTLYDFARFSKIQPYEYFRDIFKLKELPSSVNLEYFQKRCNQILIWVQYEILMQPLCKNRIIYIKKFIKIAHFCLQLGNFNSFFAIIGALESLPVSRLTTAWDAIPSKYKKLFKSFSVFYDPTSNMDGYRSWYTKYSINSDNSNGCFCIPLIPIINKDITFLNDTIMTYIKTDQINYYKMRVLAEYIRKLTYFFENSFCFNKGFLAVDTIEENYVLRKPVTSILPYFNNKSIFLSEFLSDIILTPELKYTMEKERLLLNDSTSYFKKYFDEFEMCRKSLELIKAIDTFFPSLDELFKKSYEYDPQISSIPHSTQISDLAVRKESILTIASSNIDQLSIDSLSTNKNKSDGSSLKMEPSSPDDVSQELANGAGLLV